MDTKDTKALDFGQCVLGGERETTYDQFANAQTA
jgi:hypothetical protein